MVICLERGADLHMFQLMPLPLTVSCFSIIQIGFAFLVPAHLGGPGERAVKRVCVCVCVYTVQWQRNESTVSLSGVHSDFIFRFTITSIFFTWTWVSQFPSDFFLFHKRTFLGEGVWNEILLTGCLLCYPYNNIKALMRTQEHWQRQTPSCLIFIHPHSHGTDESCSPRPHVYNMLCYPTKKYKWNNKTTTVMKEIQCSVAATASVLWRCWLGGRKGIRPEKTVGCWHGYLSAVRCRLAYVPADATATHCLLLQ